MGAVVPTQDYMGHLFRNTRDSFEDALPRYKVGLITLPNTTDQSDTTTVNLYEQFGITKLMAIDGWQHATENSIITELQPLTSVQGNVLTLTVLTPTAANEKHVYAIYGI